MTHPHLFPHQATTSSSWLGTPGFLPAVSITARSPPAACSHQQQARPWSGSCGSSVTCLSQVVFPGNTLLSSSQSTLHVSQLLPGSCTISIPCFLSKLLDENLKGSLEPGFSILVFPGSLPRSLGRCPWTVTWTSGTAAPWHGLSGPGPCSHSASLLECHLYKNDQARVALVVFAEYFVSSDVKITVPYSVMQTSDPQWNGMFSVISEDGRENSLPHGPCLHISI